MKYAFGFGVVALAAVVVACGGESLDGPTDAAGGASGGSTSGGSTSGGVTGGGKGGAATNGGSDTGGGDTGGSAVGGEASGGASGGTGGSGGGGGTGGVAPVCPHSAVAGDSCAPVCPATVKFARGAAVTSLNTLTGMESVLGASATGDLLIVGGAADVCSSTTKFAKRDGVNYIVSDISADVDVPKKDGIVDGNLTYEGKLLFTNAARNGFVITSIDGNNVLAPTEGPFGPLNLKVAALAVDGAYAYKPVLSGDGKTFGFNIIKANYDVVAYQARLLPNQTFGDPTVLKLPANFALTSLGYDALIAFADAPESNPVLKYRAGSFTRASVTADFVENQLPIHEGSLQFVWHFVGTSACGGFYAIDATGGCGSQNIISVAVKP